MSGEEFDYESAIFSPHAMNEMARRGLSEKEVRIVLSTAPREDWVRMGRVVLTALQRTPDGRDYVVRVSVDVDRQPPVVVTAYRSSKIRKYWNRT